MEGEGDWNMDVHEKQLEANVSGDVSGVITMEERVQNIYQCAVCLKEFSRKSTCKSHMKLHTGERPYECETCGMTFASKSNLTNHALTHTHQKCTTCGKTFTSKPLLKSHMVMHSSERPHECTLCGRCFKRKGELRSHIVTHTGEKRFKCQVCGNLFTERHSLKTHMRLHTGEKPYKCTVCQKTFSRKSSYNSHSRMHTGVQPYKCFVCGRRFAHRSVMVSHSRKHMIRECAMCEMSFLKESELTAHVREQHQDDWPHRCNICSISFTNGAKVKKHMRLHTESKPFPCTICSRQFLHKSSLENHLLSHSESEGRPTCEICGKSYTAKLSLEIHMRTHTGEKPFACSVCGKRFTRKSGCISHMRLHTGEKPYSCKICGKRFGYSSGIRTHMKIHKRPECNLCGVKLIGGIDPKKHVTHNIVAVGAKCSLCDIEFKSLSLFKGHLYKHTVSEREEECHKNAEAMGIALGQTDIQEEEEEDGLLREPELPVIVEDELLDRKTDIPEVAMLEAFPNQEDFLTSESKSSGKKKKVSFTPSLMKVKQENVVIEGEELFDTTVLEVSKDNKSPTKVSTIRINTKEEKTSSCSPDIAFDATVPVSPLRDVESFQSSLSPSALSNPQSPSSEVANRVSSINCSSDGEAITISDKEFFVSNVPNTSKIITISTCGNNKSPIISVVSPVEKSPVKPLQSKSLTLPKVNALLSKKKGNASPAASESISKKKLYVKDVKPIYPLSPVIKFSSQKKSELRSAKTILEYDIKSKLASASKKLFEGEDVNLAKSYSAYVRQMLSLIKPPEKQMALIKALNNTMDEFIEQYQSWK